MTFKRNFKQLIRLLNDYFKIIFDSLILLSKKNYNCDAVAIVRLDAIGDFVLWLNSAIEMSNFYKSKNKKVILIANNAWAQWAIDLGIFDEVISLSTKRFDKNYQYRYCFLKKIRSIGFEAVVHPTFSRTLDADCLVRVSGAIEKVGYNGDFSNATRGIRKITDRWYTKLVQGSKKTEMELVSNALFCSVLTNMKCKPRVVNLIKYLNTNCNQEIMNLFKCSPFYIIFPGASWEGKMWPLENFSLVANEIYEKTGMLGVVCGGDSEKILANKLINESNAELIDFSGKTNLNDLSVLFSKAIFVLSNDTSAVHIAAAVGTKAFCIMGGGHYGRFLPYSIESEYNNYLPEIIICEMECYGCNWVCVHKVEKGTAVPCISNVATERVWAHIKNFLSHNMS